MLFNFQKNLERGTLKEDMKVMISATVNEEFQKLSLDFTSRIGLEIRSELARFNCNTSFLI